MTTRTCLLVIMALSLPLMAAPRQAALSQVQRMVDQLDVTADQKAKLDPLLEEDAKQIRALRDDASLSAEDRQKKRAEIRKATDAKIKPILTDEQWKKLEQLREERKAQQDKKK